MRQLDGKFHLDGERVVKTSNGEEIPEDEPVILFRARDQLALPTLYEYRRLCHEDGCNDFQLSALQDVIVKFEKFKQEHPERLKQPGITRGK